MAELLEGLNPSQLAAVTHERGPLLIVAGAGTGKTTTIGIITSLIKKTGGSVNVFGHDLATEREAAKVMLNDARQVIEDLNVEVTVGADKGYDAHEFIQACLEMKVTPHVAQNTSGRRSAVPDAIAGTKGYAISQQKRKLIEQGFEIGRAHV